MAIISYSVKNVNKLEDGSFMNNVDLVLGDGSASYPSGGILVDKGMMGCPRALKSLLFNDADAASTKIFKFDDANSKIRIYAESAGTYAEVSGAIAAINVSVLALGDK